MALGKLTIRNKEHLCVIRAFENALALSVLFYQDEVEWPAALRLPDLDCVSQEELEAAKEYIELLSTSFSHEKYSDAYRATLMAVIEEKGRELGPAAPAEEPARSGMPDLMAALQQAVQEAQKRAAAQASKKRKAGVPA